ncbi:MAG: nickel-dependent hydrogenase large subunit [Mariprofundaceae bacterium]|nr:nickel-dependent hydrogenase large subunit [Mariprofundaceae bacterium]
MSESRSIKVDLLTRVEGEGALHIVFDGKNIAEVQLRIFEPPRFFEGFLQGRHYTEVPDIVARICGICPVAYQMSAVHALEGLFALEIDPTVRSLRRLLYCGEWIESHALHIYMLHAPDFLGLASALELGQSQPELLKQAIRLKKCGDAILTTLGGRAVHPVSVQVGGFSRVPERFELEALLDDLRWGRDAAVRTLQLVAGFDFPDFTQSYTYVSLQHRQEYPMNEGVIAFGQVETSALLPVADFESRFVESQVSHSHALHCLLDGKPYITGPLARVVLNREKLSPLTREQLDAVAFNPNNPQQAIIARAAEMLHALDEAIGIIEHYRKPQHSHAAVDVVPGTAIAATEAPRGMLYHRYQVDAAGLITAAKIVPPTSQNQARIEADLHALMPSLALADDATIAFESERLVRSYDPCISCATHFLKVQVDRR